MAKIPYASAVGILMYAMVCTRPDITQAVGVISRFMSNPGKDHWEGVKWLLRYLKGTSDVCRVYRKKEAVLEGFADANLGGCEDSGKTTTGFVFTIRGTAISWMSRLQKSVALSTTEAEPAKELVWLKSFCHTPKSKGGNIRRRNVIIVSQPQQSSKHSKHLKYIN